ncbi:MAG: 3-phosphoshikimate 1-carboxyvinyltransferase [Ruminococcaceae bacterium]|nr:3-phosphoshikimate 1-carboxyvinyltransferase [Oscillospiraceae bacterium]
MANKVSGVVKAPPSKSAAHRALIAAALSGESRVDGIIPSQDMEATLRCLLALGKAATVDGQTVTFSGENAEGLPIADCGESGSTLRFFVPIFAALGKEVTFVGKGRLPERPMTTYADCLPPHGVTLTRPACEGGIVHIKGQLRGGEYRVAGDVSSQFITGLLFALPLCEEDSEIVLTSPLQSAGYVEMTLEVLREAGIQMEKTDRGYAVKGSQSYALYDHTVEGDWSQAAFWLTAAAIGGELTVTGLRRDSLQGDKRIEAILREMGARIEWREDGLFCRRSPLCAVEADVSDIPDLVPILSVAAAAATGTTRLYNAARLRLKESDRLQTTAAMILALGGEVTEREDELLVSGHALRGGRVDGANDHRIVMSAAIAALISTGCVDITDAHSVAKSWPSFFKEYEQIGGMIREL